MKQPSNPHGTPDAFSPERQRAKRDRITAMVRDINRAHAKVTNAGQRELYTAEELLAPSVRPGADDHKRWPSRFGNRFVWVNGREEVRRV